MSTCGYVVKELLSRAWAHVSPYAETSKPIAGLHSAALLPTVRMGLCEPIDRNYARPLKAHASVSLGGFQCQLLLQSHSQLQALAVRSYRHIIRFRATVKQRYFI